MTEKHPYGPDLEKKSSGDLSGFAYFALIDIKFETGIDECDVFSEATLAKSIRAVASDGDSSEMKMLLRDIADALDHPKASVKLKIAMPKVGRPTSFAERDEMNSQQMNIVGEVWFEFKQSGRMKPAVWAAGKKYGVSYATVYKAIRAQAKIERNRRRLDFPESQARQQWPDEQQAAYREYDDWLYGYSRAESDEAE